MSVIIKCVPWVALNDLLFPLLQVERCSTFQICIVLDVSWIYSNYSCSHTCMNLDICTHWEELEDWVVGFLIPRRMRINKRMKIHQVSDHNPISILTLIKMILLPPITSLDMNKLVVCCGPKSQIFIGDILEEHPQKSVLLYSCSSHRNH